MMNKKNTENVNKKKISLKKIIYKFIEYEGIQTIFCFICVILVILFFYKKNKAIQVGEIVDIKLFSTILITGLLITLSGLIKDKILLRLEDDVKLTKNYDELVKKYAESEKNFVTYDNSNKISQKVFYKKQKCKLEKRIFTFPVIKDADLRNKDIIILHSDDKSYTVPWSIKNAYDELLRAHHSELNYNNSLFRVNKWYITKKHFIIKTSKTTYYDSLVTNRAIDFRLKNGTSVRDMFENESKLSDLEESKLSNHLGFNGFIETSDGWIPFIKRSSNVSVGKSTFGNSVNASVKAKYAYDDKHNFKTSGLVSSILHEISDELKISYEWLQKNYEDKLKIIAAFRDVVEGGKPHVLFYIKLDITKQAMQENFDLRITKKDWSTKLTTDGKKLAWIKTDDLKMACIASNMVVCNNKVYKMTPSAAACVVMLLDYLEN